MIHEMKKNEPLQEAPKEYETVILALKAKAKINPKSYHIKSVRADNRGDRVRKVNAGPSLDLRISTKHKGQ